MIELCRAFGDAPGLLDISPSSRRHAICSLCWCGRHSPTSMLDEDPPPREPLMIPVRSIAYFLTLILCTVPAVASAQPWRDAFRAGEYAKAADLLHDIVSDPENVLQGNPDALRLLAEMYRDGLGVPRDAMAACSLAQDAEMATQMAPPARPMQTMNDAVAYQALQTQAHEFATAVCGALSGAERLAAERSRGGCYGFGMPEETIRLGNHSVRLSRAGIVLAGTPERDMGGLFGCHVAIALARSRTVEVPENAPTSLEPRHFVELYSWRRPSVPTAGGGTFELSWQLFEVQGKEMMPRLPFDIVLATSSSIPQGLPPGAEAGLTLQMVRSGHVLWRVDGAPPKRGWIMLPDRKESR